MELVTGYAGEPHVQADDLRELYAGMAGDGAMILPVGNKCRLSMTTANDFSISDGSILVQGAHVRIRPGEKENLTVENGTVGEKRHDLIVVRYERDAGSGIETASPVVKKGTPAASPTDPEVVTGDIRAGDLVHEEPLYRICLNGINVEKTECLVQVAPSMLEIFDRLQKCYTKDEVDKKVKTVSDDIATANNTLSGMLGRAYPVGAIYMSVNPTSPAELFGGKWETWGTGRVPVGVSWGEGEFNGVERMGGSKYVNLRHKHAGTLGYDGNAYYTMNKFGSTTYPTNTNGEGYAFHAKESAKVSVVRVNYTSEALDNNTTNMQPYITCYMWKRTA